MQFDAKDVRDNKTIAALSYVGVLCLFPLFLKKDSRYVQTHAKQGLALFLAEIIIWVLNILPFIGPFIWMLFSLVFVAVSIIAIIKTMQGEYWEIPVVSQYSEKIKI